MGGSEVIPTPRTDVEEKEAAASHHHCGQDSHIEAGFARKLETELTEARACAMDEAADILIKDGYWNPAYTLRAKATEIRKGDLMQTPSLQGD